MSQSYGAESIGETTPGIDAVEARVFAPGASEAALTELAQLIHSFWHTEYIKDYIWQVDQPQLRLSTELGVAHLSTFVRFGDNIDDEWFLVWLLLEASKKFKDIIISVVDNDGQFLLIEAASKIPKWLKPENSENRVWIHQGGFHIIPLPRNPSELLTLPVGKDLTVKAALNIVKTQSVPTLVDIAVSQFLFTRIEAVKKSVKESNHFGRVGIPDSIAYLLQRFPQLIAKAVVAYYYRDPLQLKVCKKMETFPAKNVNLRTVRFTRCLYAQLLRQKLEFVPHGYSPIPANDSANLENKYLELGYKLACGFEILYHDELKKSKKDKYEEKTFENIEKYLKEGAESNFKVTNMNEEPSSEQWLYISPKEVEDMLAQREAEFTDYYEKKKNNKTNSKISMAQGGESDLPKDNVFDDMIEKTRAFLNSDSDYTGVEFKGETKEGDDDDNDDIADDEQFLQYFKQKFGKNVFNSGTKDGDESSEEDDEFYGDFGNEDDPRLKAAIDEEMRELMDDMDDELKGTPIGEDMDDDVNLNLVRSFLESYHAQGGEAGPVSNLMNLLMQAEKGRGKKKDE